MYQRTTEHTLHEGRALASLPSGEGTRVGRGVDAERHTLRNAEAGFTPPLIPPLRGGRSGVRGISRCRSWQAKCTLDQAITTPCTFPLAVSGMCAAGRAQCSVAERSTTRGRRPVSGVASRTEPVRREQPIAPCGTTTWGGRVPRRIGRDRCPVGSLRRTVEA